jgi:hypothetical protein
MKSMDFRNFIKMIWAIIKILKIDFKEFEWSD